MITGILGKKLGMTQIFDDKGKRIPVTVLGAGPCVVQAVKSEKTDGYNAVCLGYQDAKENRINKPQREYLKSKKLKPMKFVKEIRCAQEPGVKVGTEVKNNIFQQGDYLDIEGTSKGKGFQGGMKRCGWSGGKDTHGSMSHRAPGSIGASAYPSRVLKGHPLPGQMGNVRKTVQSLEVIEVDTENNTICVKGAVPGAIGSYLTIRYALKKELAPRIQPEEPEEEVQEEVAEPVEQSKEEVKEEKQEQPKEEPKEEAQEESKE